MGWIERRQDCFDTEINHLAGGARQRGCRFSALTAALRRYFVAAITGYRALNTG